MRMKEKKFEESMRLILENKVWRAIMEYIEMTVEEAIESS